MHVTVTDAYFQIKRQFQEPNVGEHCARYKVEQTRLPLNNSKPKVSEKANPQSERLKKK